MAFAYPAALARQCFLIGGIAATALFPLAGGGAAQPENIYSGQGYGGGNDGGGTTIGTSRANPWGIAGSTSATPAATAQVTQAIRDSYGFCASLGPGYLVDCLGEQLQTISSGMSRSGDYGEARGILAEAGAELRAIARANRDRGQARKRVRGQVRNRRIQTGPLTAVRPDRAAGVRQAAVAVLQDAETKLLRSAQASDRRLVAYAEMAKAVGSNKTLLRSA